MITKRFQRTLSLVLLLLLIPWNNYAQRKGRLYLSQIINKEIYSENEHEARASTSDDLEGEDAFFYSKYIAIFDSIRTVKKATLSDEAASDLVVDNLVPLGPKASLLRRSTYHQASDNSSHGLWIELKDSEYLYRDELLWSLDSVGTLKKVSFHQQSRLLKQAIRAIKTLEKESKYARNIIRTLQHSQNKFTISLLDITESYMLLPLPDGRLGVLNNNAYAFQAIENRSLLVDYAPFDQIGSGAEIRWNPDLGIIKLAHELSHAYDANYGLLDDRLMPAYGEVMSAREIRALFHENTIRKELKIRLKRKANTGGAFIIEGTPYTYPLPVSARY